MPLLNLLYHAAKMWSAEVGLSNENNSYKIVVSNINIFYLTVELKEYDS